MVLGVLIHSWPTPHVGGYHHVLVHLIFISCPQLQIPRNYLARARERGHHGNCHAFNKIKKIRSARVCAPRDDHPASLMHVCHAKCTHSGRLAKIAATARQINKPRKYRALMCTCLAATAQRPRRKLAKPSIPTS